MKCLGSLKRFRTLACCLESESRLCPALWTRRPWREAYDPASMVRRRYASESLVSITSQLRVFLKAS